MQGLKRPCIGSKICKEMYVQDYVHFSPPSVGAAAERDERIHDQVGELSDVFCSPRFTGKVKLSRRSVPGAKRACRDVRGA